MTRNLKALGVIAAAALAMSAAFASAAQAETPRQFKAGETPANHTTSILHGVQEGTEVDNFFQIEHPEGAAVTCTNGGVTFAGEVPGGTASTLTVTPTYTECWQSGTTRNVTVTMNGCDYTFTQPTELAGGEITGKADLHCPLGSVIEVHIYAADGVLAHNGTHGALLCTITIKPVNANTEQITEQELGGHVIYSNLPQHVGGKDAVTVDATIEGIYWQKHGLCSPGTAQGHDGTYRNTVTVTGADNLGNPHDVWVG